MKSKKSRGYTMTNRAKSAAKTDLKVINATAELWKTTPISEITLEMIAQNAGVTVRTILRKFGSKEGVFEAGLKHDAANIGEERNKAPLGDIDEIISTLLANYEDMGDAAIRTIYMENDFGIARQIGEKGRAMHRDWCAKMFARFLPERDADDYELKLTALIASTEIYLWKLLRRDLGHTKDQTHRVFKMLVEGVILKFKSK